jgi:quinol monooxygenase YgiN
MQTLTRYIDLDPTDVNAFAADIRNFSVITREERECLFYTAAVEDADTGRMLIAERWQDQASLKAHLEAPSTIDFLKKWGSRINGDLLKYDAANERSLMDFT